MKQSLKLSLAISLALGAGQAFGLGLGQIQVNSRLNQPLDAEIPVLVDRRGEAESLVVKLASAEEFARIGIERSQIGVPLEFALGQSARGETVIKVTSKEAVHAPFLDFLLEANWSNGRVLREYTVLLDPPLSTPASAARTVAAEPAPAAAAVTRPAPPPPIAKPAPAATRSEPVAETAKPVATPQPVAAAAPAAAPAPVPTPVQRPAAPVERAVPPSVAASNGSNYGPVAAGETLWEIAQATLPDDGANVNQVMLALLKANPDAFVKNNINQLKRGAILRIPSGEEIRAVGSARAAAAQVQAQVADWRSGASRPTLLAGGSASPAPSGEGATSRQVDDRLSLVPPEMGKDGLASTGQAGSSAGAAGGNASVAELARANEALETRNREASDLRNRVQDLESLQNKNERLISLKDSEIAELQRKLAAAQAAGDQVASKPVAASSADTSTPVTAAADDIWGKTATPEPAAPVPAVDAAAAETKVPPTDATATATTADAAATDAPITSTPADATAVGAVPNSAAVETTAEPVVAEAVDTAAVGAADAVVSPTPIEAPAVATPAESTPLVDTPAPISTPMAADQPWYMNPLLWGGAGVVVLLAGLLAARSRRKPVEPRPSLADQFAAAGPAGLVPDVAQEADGAIASDEEGQLEWQIAARPDDLGARLELLSIYYADNRVDEFRRAAEQMQAHVEDPTEPEWVQVRAMGEDLMPGDPLFTTLSDASSAATSSLMTDRWEDADAALDKAASELRWSDEEAAIESAETAHEAPVVSVFDREEDDSRYAPARTADVFVPVTPVEDDIRDVDAELAALDLDHEVTDDAGLELEFSLEEFESEPEPSALSARDVDAPKSEASVRPLTEFVGTAKPDESFGFDLPPLDFDMEFTKPQAAVEPTSAPLMDDVVESDDEFFVGEDALGTKLDLARAYADMGDPDGARAMLEEVIAEGDAGQKDQARKMLDSLG